MPEVVSHERRDVDMEHTHKHVHSPEEKKAVINNTGKVLLKNHMSHCIGEAVEEENLEAVEKLNMAIDRFMG